ncbi:MAG TPA: pyridoxal-dependent decarboxylase, partial [Candidatus Methanoperedens sp.]
KEDFTIDVEKLEDRILADKYEGFYPLCVIGNGGTVNTGAVDILDLLADVCSKYDLWFHVGAAYGGPAAATTLARHLFKGIDRADSIALDPHKWLYVPFETGCVLVRNRHHLRDTFSILPDYLRLDLDKSERFDFMEYSFQLSRNFKVWMTFKTYGAEMLRASIEEKYLSLLNKKLLEAVERDGRIFITGTMIQGKTALRACCVNHRTQPGDVEYLLGILRELDSNIQGSLQENE